tara:strand:- start:2422 stop:4158 length:1737 start_codon:yes stop_codon:yes gene_type:complete
MSENKSFFQKLLFLTKSSKIKIFYIIGLYIVSTCIDLLSLGVIGSYVAYIIDQSLITNVYLSFTLQYWQSLINIEDLIISTGLLLVALFIFKALFSVFIHSQIIKFSHFSQTYLRMNLMSAYENIPFKHIVNRDTSEFAATMGNYVKSYGAALASALQFAGDIVTSITIIFFLFFVNGTFVIFMALGALIILILYRIFFVYRLKIYGERLTNSYKKLYQSINEFFLGFKELKILNSFNYFENSISSNSMQIAQSDIRQQITLLTPRFIFELAVVIFIVGMVVFAQLNQLSTLELIPTLSIFALASIRLAPIAYQMIRHIGTFDYSEAAINKIITDYKFIEEYSNLKQAGIAKKSYENFQSLTFNSVCFGYNEYNFLKDINLKIEKNCATAIVGPSGSGKTSLINLMLGLVVPKSGEILFNNKSLDSYLSNFRDQIAYLPQEIFLINNSISANIALGVNESEVDSEKLIESAKKSKIFDFIDELPLKFKSSVGERGISISGGQRQRIAIARAFYFNRDVLIFDEPTSSLDQSTETEIIDYLQYLKKHKTIIIVSHNTEVLKFCDQIYNINNETLEDIKL